MTERGEEQIGGSLWQLAAAVILFNIISRVLGAWLAEPVAIGTGLFAVALLSYGFNPSHEVGFSRWALGSLLFSAGYVGFVFGASYILCERIGAVLTWGLIGFVLFMSFRFVSELFFKQKAKDELWKWLVVSAGVGLLLAFIAYIRPGAFC